MQKLKSFIYLDTYKMYSFSSQIFEGITEYIINEDSHKKEDHENQKGPVGSGKVLADIAITTGKSVQKKFLHDYAYSIFEEELIKKDKVEIITMDSPAPPESSGAEGKNLVKIIGKASFIDIIKLTEMIKGFNSMGYALSYVTNFEEIKNSGNTNKGSIKSAIEKLARQSNLHYDEEFLKSLAYLVDYGFKDQLEVKISHEKFRYAAELNREFLREKEDILMRKYSRNTDKDLVILGHITQNSSSAKVETDDLDPSGIKEAVLNMVMQMANLESTFYGRMEDEVIIDPIAVYTEI